MATKTDNPRVDRREALAALERLRKLVDKRDVLTWMVEGGDLPDVVTLRRFIEHAVQP